MVYSPWCSSVAGARCFLTGILPLSSPWLKTFPEVEDWKEKHAGKAPVRNDGRHSYRGEHRIIILMTFAAAAALWFCFAGNLPNAAIVAGWDYCARLSLSALW